MDEQEIEYWELLKCLYKLWDKFDDSQLNLATYKLNEMHKEMEKEFFVELGKRIVRDHENIKKENTPSNQDLADRIERLEDQINNYDS